MRTTTISGIVFSFLFFPSLGQTMNARQDVSFNPAPIVSAEMDAGGHALRATVEYPNTCYQPWQSMQEVEGDRLMLTHIAQFDNQAMCSQALQYFETNFEVGNLRPGTYEVIDGNDGKPMGQLERIGEDHARFYPY